MKRFTCSHDIIIFLVQPAVNNMYRTAVPQHRAPEMLNECLIFFIWASEFFKNFFFFYATGFTYTNVF